MERRKVDFPQPDGPMMAVTALRSIANTSSRRTCRSPYQKEKPRTSTAGAPRSAPGVGGCRGASVALGVVT